MPEAMSYLDAIKHIFPELAMTCALCLVLVWEMAFPKRNGEKAILTLGFLGITSWLLIQRLNWHPATVFGMVRVDYFATIFKLFIVACTACVVIYDIQDRRHQGAGKGETWFLLLTACLGSFFLVGTTHMLLLYLGLETLGLCSYALAGIHKRDRLGAEAALKYVIYGALASGVMLFGISLLYGLSGSLDVRDMTSMVATLSADGRIAELFLPTLMLLVGFGFKLSLFPFQWWAPDVYQGVSTPVAGFLAVGSKGVALAAMIRIFAVLFGELIPLNNGVIADADFMQILIVLLGVLAAVTMIFGNLAALRQDNLKRMLAYSSIGHAGYMLVGVSLMTPSGFEAALLYALVYFPMTLGAFGAIQYFANQSGTESISGLKGLGFKHPIAGAATIVFLAALTGLPPTAGFAGKLYLMTAAWDGGMFVLTLIIALMSVVSLFYYFRIAKALYLAKEKTTASVVSLPLMSGLLTLLAAATIYFMDFDLLVAVAKSGIISMNF